MEEWQSMRDNAFLDGDTLHGSRVINEWGLGFGSSYLIKEDDGIHILMYWYMIFLNIWSV